MDMSEEARAYIEEYGAVPSNRSEQDRYSAFRFGYQAGRRVGYEQALLQVAADVERRMTT